MIIMRFVFRSLGIVIPVVLAFVSIVYAAANISRGNTGRGVVGIVLLLVQGPVLYNATSGWLAQRIEKVSDRCCRRLHH